LLRRHPHAPSFPYTTLFRSTVPVQVLPRLQVRHLKFVRAVDPTALGVPQGERPGVVGQVELVLDRAAAEVARHAELIACHARREDRKSTRLNSSHRTISYAV